MVLRDKKNTGKKINHKQKMSKTAKIIIGIVAVAIIAYVGYTWYTKNNAVVTPGITPPVV